MTTSDERLRLAAARHADLLRSCGVTNAEIAALHTEDQFRAILSYAKKLQSSRRSQQASRAAE